MKKSVIALILLAIGGLSFTLVNSIPENVEVLEAQSAIEQEEVKQSTGIKFSNMSLEDAKKLSKKTGKPIFIDCYTDWCGPCKALSSKVFTDPAVGDLFNKKFINLKLEMEKTADGRQVGSTYKVRGYPTLLFINGNGEVEKMAVGYKTAEQLIQIARSV